MQDNLYNSPRRRSITVVTGGSSGPVWAVNVGTTSGPSLSVEDGVVTGQTTGTAAIFKGVTFTRAEVSDARKEYMRMDDGGDIADGTIIQVQTVSGRLCCVFANCGPTDGLTGLDPTP